MENFTAWHIEPWHILAGLAIAMFIIEIFTTAFFFASIGVGLILAALGGFIGMGPSWQLLFFACGVGLTYFLIRPFITKMGFNKGTIKTNRDALIEKIGTVTEEIDSNQKTGRVKIDGIDWKAISSENQMIKKGTTVKIIDIDSIVLCVKPIN